jgi:hypothetical protein
MDNQFTFGRSRRNIHARLLCHRRVNGNRKIAEKINKSKFKFEWEIMLSVEQAEARLIKALGTRKYFNLRPETDPADRDGTNAAAFYSNYSITNYVLLSINSL